MTSHPTPAPTLFPLHPVTSLCGPMQPDGILDLTVDQRPDRFHLWSAPLAETAGTPFFSSFLLRERCRNVMFFRPRITVELAGRQLHRLRGEPVTRTWKKRIRPLLPEPQHAACLANSPPNLFEVVDRLTSMGRVEGWPNFFILGFLAGSLTLAATAGHLRGVEKPQQSHW